MHILRVLAILVIAGMLGCEKGPSPEDHRAQDSGNSCQLFEGLDWTIGEGDYYKWKHEESGDVVEVKILKIEPDGVQLWARKPKYQNRSRPPFSVRTISEETLVIDTLALPFVIPGIDLSGKQIEWKWVQDMGCWRAETEVYQNSYYTSVVISPKPGGQVPDIGYRRVYINGHASFVRLRWYRAVNE